MCRAPVTSILAALASIFPASIGAQDHEHHHPPAEAPPGPSAPAQERPLPVAADHGMGMPGLIWSSMSLESSGTAWQPASTPMTAPMIHFMRGVHWMHTKTTSFG